MPGQQQQNPIPTPSTEHPRPRPQQQQQQQWDPTTPSTLLWAHELRRENIHLINRLDSTHADLTSLTSTVADQQRTTAHLADQITTVDNRYDARLDGLRDGFTQRIDLLCQRVEVLEAERVRLVRRVGELEGVVGGLLGGRSGGGGCVDVDVDVLKHRRGGIEVLGCGSCRDGRGGGGGGRIVLQGKTDRQRHSSQRDEHSESDSDSDQDEDKVLVPDSFPQDKSKSQPDVIQPHSNDDDYLSPHHHHHPTPDPPTPSPATPATATTTTSTVTVTTNDSPNPPSMEVPDQPPAVDLQQGARTLEEYIRYGEALRADLAPCRREGGIVERFVRGLSDERVRGLVERRMGCVEWVWERMVGVLREVDSTAAGGAAVAAVEENGAGAAATVAGDGNNGRGEDRRRVKRRRISIVPADEEDLLQMAGMHVR